jgi:O-antigen/teichoic acid export membrane protein
MFKDALKQFLTYGAGSIAQTALSFILLPLYLHFFEPSEYGVISLLATVVSLLSILTSTGIVSGLYRLYYEAKVGERKKLVGTTWLWYLLGASLGWAILFIYSSSISTLLFHSGDYSYLVRLISFTFFLSTQHSIPLNILRMEKKPSLYVGFSLFDFAVGFALKLYLIVFLRRGLEGYFESSVISSIIVLCSMLPFVLKYVTFSLNASYLKQLLRLGFPYIFSGIAFWTLNMSDRLILNHFRGEAAVGSYSLAYNFANLFNVFLFSPSALFWHPFFFSYAAERSTGDTKRLLNRSLVYFFIVGCILYLLISLGSGDVLRILNSVSAAKEGYLQASKLVPLLTLGPFLYLLNRQASCALLMAKKPESTATAACIAAGVSLGLNFVLIPRLGAAGAAIANVTAYATNLGLIYYWAQRIWPVNHDWKGLIKGLLFLAGAFLIAWYIPISQPWASMFVRIITGVTVFALCTWFIGHILSKEEQTKLSAYLTDGRRRLARVLLHRCPGENLDFRESSSREQHNSER